MTVAHADGAQYVVYFIFASIAILFSTAAVRVIVRWGDLRFNVTKLMLALHGTMLAEEIATLPFAYVSNPTICGGVGFLSTYFGLANAVATAFLMGFFYFGHVYNERIPIAVSAFIHRWGALGTFGFPLITLLPFSTNSYGEVDDAWCRIRSDSRTDDVWSLVVYHLWTLLAMVASGFMIFRSISAACKIHADIGGKLFSSLGVYALIALVCWTFRFIVNLWEFSPVRQNDRSAIRLLSNFLVQIMGIGFSLTLFRDASMVLDMRTGSEMFSKSSFATSSILNWEIMMERASELQTGELDLATVEVPNPIRDVPNPIRDV